MVIKRIEQKQEKFSFISYWIPIRASIIWPVLQCAEHALKPNVLPSPIQTQTHIIRRATLFSSPALCIFSALGNVHYQPDDQARCEAYSKQEWEAMPGIARLVDDRLNHIRPNN